MSLHVVPVGDLIDHTTTEDCPCGPRDQTVKQDDGSIRWMVIHHSLDGREQAEAPTPPGGGPPTS